LGAKLPDLRAHSPSKIAAGFGGTLNLVVSAVYIVVIVLLTAVPVHLKLTPPPDSPPSMLESTVRFLGSTTGIECGVVLTIATGIAATVWPMRIGLVAFRNLEL
jgi:ABC-2 type transport system permease protein